MTNLFEHDFDDAYSSLDITHNESGYDYNNEAGYVQAEENIFGGHDFITDGVHDGHSESNIFNGHDYYNAEHQLVGRTMDDGIGGEYVYSHDGFEGVFRHDTEGHETFMDSEGDITHFDSAYDGNASHIMSYDDPLAHIDGYIMPDLIL